jgi:hypothetical protein
MKHVSIIVLLIASFTIISCSKSSDNSPTNSNPNKVKCIITKIELTKFPPKKPDSANWDNYGEYGGFAPDIYLSSGTYKTQPEGDLIKEDVIQSSLPIAWDNLNIEIFDLVTPYNIYIADYDGIYLGSEQMADVNLTFITYKGSSYNTKITLSSTTVSINLYIVWL